MSQNMSLIISQEELEKLNRRITELIETKKHTIINFDLLEQLYGKLLRSKDMIKENPKRTIVPIKQTEMIEEALIFFESIDKELYEKAKAILEGRDGNVSINFTNASDDRNWYDESNVKTQSGKSVINILTQIEVPRGQKLETDMCTLEDLFLLVHEITHTFDIDYTKKKSEEKGNPINPTRDFYGESLPLAFETLLTEYLIKNLNYPIDAIEQRYYRRTNDLYDMTGMQYAKLLLAKVKEQDGEITNENLQEFIQNNGLGLNYARYIVSRINDDPQSFMGRNRYPIASLISPQIVTAYKKGGTATIKEYLTAVKDDRQEDLLKTLGVTMDEEGLSKLVLGAIEQDRNIQDYTHQKENEEDDMSLEEKTKNFEENYKKHLFDKIGNLRERHFQALAQIKETASDTRIDSDLPDISITLNNKIVDLSQQFKKAGISLFSQEKEGFAGYRYIGSSFIGEAIIFDLIDYVSRATQDLSTYTETMRRIADRKTGQSQELEKTSPMRRIFAKIRNIFVPNQQVDIFNPKEAASMNEILSGYREENEELLNYNLEENLVDSLVKYITQAESGGGLETGRRYHASDVPALLDECVLPDLIKLGLEHLVPELQEKLIEEYKKDLHYMVSEENMNLYVPNFNRDDKAKEETEGTGFELSIEQAEEVLEQIKEFEQQTREDLTREVHTNEHDEQDDGNR